MLAFSETERAMSIKVTNTSLYMIRELDLTCHVHVINCSWPLHMSTTSCAFVLAANHTIKTDQLGQSYMYIYIYIL